MTTGLVVRHVALGLHLHTDRTRTCQSRTLAENVLPAGHANGGRICHSPTVQRRPSAPRGPRGYCPKYWAHPPLLQMPGRVDVRVIQE